MTNGPSTAAARPRPRRLTRFALVAALMTLFVTTMPGTASAAGVVPSVDCYAQNSNGTFTVILGYTSSYTSTQTIPRGTRNYATPSTYTSQLPTSFKRGENHGAAKLTISANDLYYGNVSWYLDGTTLNYWTAAQNVGICSAAQLPALSHGGGLVVILLVAGAVGVVVVRRARNAALTPSSGVSAG